VKDETTIMRATRAEGFSGYKDLKLVDIPKPAVSDGRVLVRITAGGVTPLNYAEPVTGTDSANARRVSDFAVRVVAAAEAGGRHRFDLVGFSQVLPLPNMRSMQ
jgi:NADPH:quinone reductase-like Zn-dependent oxidoreductase